MTNNNQNQISGSDVSSVPPVIAQYHSARPPAPTTRNWRGIATLTVVLGLVALLAMALPPSKDHAVRLGRNDPRLLTLQTLTSLDYPSQLADAQPLCTDQGFATLQCMATNTGEFLSTFTVRRAKCNPRMCDIQLSRDTAEGETVVSVRLVNIKGWKFQDMYLEKANGRTANLWTSQIIEHPVIAMAIIHKEEITKGVETAGSVLKYFVDLVKPFKST